jgi:hypothetical protein
MRPRVIIAVAATALVLASGACGRKTDPLIPDSPRPEAVKDIKIAVRDANAYLSWPVPVKNVEGKDLPPAAIGEFRIERAELERERGRPRYKQVASVSMADHAPAEVRNGAVFWSDSGLVYGRVYGYRIRAYSRAGGVSPYSEEVRAAPLLSLAAPTSVSATGADSVVTLTWDPVTARSDGTPHEGFTGYNVYRGTEPGRQHEAPVNTEPVGTNVYKDTGVTNGRTYFYRLRAVDSPVAPWNESVDSAEVSATPRDMTPPRRPTGITVVPGVRRVFLTWNENKEADLAGYHVYRSVRSGRGYERLTATPIFRSTYSDETVRQGMTYYYVITAVDKSGNESARSKEYKTYTEKLR